LLLCRQQKTIGFYHCFIQSTIAESCVISNKTAEGCYSFPLYLYEGKKRRPNLNPKIITEIENKLNLSFVPEKGDSLTLAADGFKEGSFSSSQLVENSFCPLDLFDYIYAVLHSPAYRETYREFLKIDFPRIPYPAAKKTFWKLAALGGELRRLHLLEGPEFEKIDADSAPSAKVSHSQNSVSFENGSGKTSQKSGFSTKSKVAFSKTEVLKKPQITVEKVRYSEGKVFVNDDFCFYDVPLAAWEFFIGGYQPAQKWLKDRKGCILKGGDLAHYRKIVLALTRTARIMGEIDGVGVV
jgi:predicted helicase